MAEELTAEEKAELAQRRAEKEAARKAACIKACIEAARAAFDKAGKYLEDIEGGVTLDEARIAAMASLREAINHINEAG
jgi:hypothetical protein